MSSTTKGESTTVRSRTVLGTGFALGLLVGFGMLIGSWMAVSFFRPQITLPETLLHAVATDGGETFSIATGPISDGVEGIFCLDFLTGELKCWVLNNRSNQIGGYFAHNIVPDLGVDPSRKNPRYLMVTGQTGLRGGGAAMRPSECVVYVADANSGNVVGYAIPWNRTVASRSAQQGVLVPVFKQAARQIEIRGQ